MRVARVPAARFPDEGRTVSWLIATVDRQNAARSCARTVPVVVPYLYELMMVASFSSVVFA